MSAARRDPELSAAIELSTRLSAPDPVRVRTYRIWGRVFAAAVSIAGFAVTIGWLSDWMFPAEIAADLTAMTFATSICFGLLGFVFATIHSEHHRVLSWARMIAASTVITMVSRDVRRSYLGIESGSDDIWASDPSDIQGQMPILLAALFLLLALAAIMPVLNRDGFGQWLALPALAVGVVTGNAVLFDLHALEDVPPVRDFSVHTPLLLILLATSALMQSSAHGWVALGMGNGDSAMLLRRLFPRATLSLIAATSLGYLLYRSETTSAAFGFGVGAGLTILVNATLSWRQAQKFHDIDLRRAGAEHVMNQARAALAERDAMARRLGASQQRLRRVLDTSVDAYVSIDQDGCVTEWNEAATQLFGWSYAEALGSPLDTLIIPQQFRDAHLEGLSLFFATGRGPVLDKPSELVAVRRDGTEVDIELRVWPLEEHGSTHFHAFIRDISTRKHAEAELLRANRELEEFAAVAAHDLRSPLVAISLTAELIVMQESQGHSDSTVEWANRILEATQRGNALINDLLTLSQISRGPKEFEKVDIDDIVRRIADETLDTAGRPATIDIDPLDPVHGDPVLLRQLFTNLITNAVKYVPEGRDPHVRVHSEPVEHGLIGYCVCDNGDGIPEQDLPAIFDMFHRGENSIGSTGSGIGLAICRRVVEHHGGQIHVENKDQSGALFTVTLPA